MSQPIDRTQIASILQEVKEKTTRECRISHAEREIQIGWSMPCQKRQCCKIDLKTRFKKKTTTWRQRKFFA